MERVDDKVFTQGYFVLSSPSSLFIVGTPDLGRRFGGGLEWSHWCHRRTYQRDEEEDGERHLRDTPPDINKGRDIHVWNGTLKRQRG